MKRSLLLLLLIGLPACDSADTPPLAADNPPLSLSQLEPLRINAGGPSVTINGVRWRADEHVSGGKSYQNARVTQIAGTDDDVLYLTEHSATQNLGTFRYDVPVPSGRYEVKLHFAEIYWGAAGGGPGGAGKRVFSVNLEGGTPELRNYDINKEVGPAAAVVKSYEVDVKDGALTIDFSSSVDQPKVSAIEVLPLTPPADEGAGGGAGNGAGDGVTGFTLINADTDAPLGALEDGATVNVTRTGTRLSVRADLAAPVGSVRFTLDGKDYRTENVAPYALAGDGNGGRDYYAWTPSLGRHTLTATPFAGARAAGAKKAALTVTFTVVDTVVDTVTNEGGGRGAWRTLASSSRDRQEVAYVQVGGTFYLAGGGTLHEAYDPAKNAWRTLAPLPANLDHIQSVSVDGLVYYIGGLSGWPGPNVSTVYIYNPKTNTFRQGAPMPAGRGRGAGGVSVHGGKIYYAGGLNGGRSGAKAVAWFDVYDPAQNRWQRLPDMPTPRDHFQAAVVDGVFYAIGGRDKDINKTTAAVDAYDFSNGTWSTLPTRLPTERGGFATAVLGREILVIGGEGGGKAHNEVEAYNPATNTWRTLTPLPTARHGVQAAVCNGGVYIAAGGKTQAGGNPSRVHEALFLGSPTSCAPTASKPTPPAQVFTKVTWQGVANAPLKRVEAQGAVANGKMYVFGGYTSFSPFCTTTQSHGYDPAKNTWKRLKDLPEAWTHAGVAVDGSDVYLAGGYRNEPNCTRTEVATRTVYKYDTQTDTWTTPLPPLPQARGSGGLARLGRELHFFGGTDTDRQDKADHWALSLDGGSWEPRASLPNPRSHMGFTVLGGKIYAIGGQYCYEGCAKTQRLVHRYDPATDAWTRVADLPESLSHHTSSTFVMENRIIVVGGEKAHTRHVKNVRAYDPATDAWTELTPLPSEGNAGVAGVVGGTLFYTGGGGFSPKTYRGIPAD